MLKIKHKQACILRALRVASGPVRGASGCGAIPSGVPEGSFGTLGAINARRRSFCLFGDNNLGGLGDAHARPHGGDVSLRLLIMLELAFGAAMNQPRHPVED